MFTEYPTMTLSLIVDFIMTIIVLASILYAINAKTENKAIATDDDDDTKKEEESEFISEWISVIKEIIDCGINFDAPHNSMIMKALCSHKNPKVLDLIKVYRANKIEWSVINYNREPWAINLLIDNKDKIIWGALCGNKNPKVIPLLKERIEYENKHDINRLYSDTYNCNNKIDWNILQQNPNAKELIMNRINDEFSGMIESELRYIRVNKILPILLETSKNKDIESVKIFKKLIMREIATNSKGKDIDWSTILNTLFNDFRFH